MPRTITPTKGKKVAPKSANTEIEEQAEEFPKIKKVLEIDEPEAIPGTEEKLDEDGMPIVDEEDAESDELGLDDTEDFGDRWEE